MFDLPVILSISMLSVFSTSLLLFIDVFPVVGNSVAPEGSVLAAAAATNVLMFLFLVLSYHVPLQVTLNNNNLQ